MNTFGAASRKQLVSADTRLHRIAYAVLATKDHSIIKAHRSERDQGIAFAAGHTKLEWPHGKHNELPSKALDVRTYPVPEADTEYKAERMLREEQLYLLGLYVGVAAQMGITLRTGADWDRDGEIADNGFDDFFHVEIVGA